MKLSRSTMGLAIGAMVIAATTAAAPHITPMVVLTEQADVIRRTLDDADEFFVRTVEIGRDALASIREEVSFELEDPEYNFYYGTDMSGRVVGVVLFPQANTQHGPVEVGLTLDRDGVVVSAIMTKATAESRAVGDDGRGGRPDGGICGDAPRGRHGKSARRPFVRRAGLDAVLLRRGHGRSGQAGPGPIRRAVRFERLILWGEKGRAAPPNRSGPSLHAFGYLDWLKSNNVLRSRTLLPFHDLELHRVTLVQGLKTLCLDCGVVDKAILAVVLRRNESEALLIVEPLHSPSRTHRPTPLVVIVGSPDDPYRLTT